ncbi:MAG: hypothetical protein BGO98_41075 [Myxococcales bacterium 68-20]|nr:MAG: hypothetical protein BGO98_41075 [Myxococcales bacterium 68-20]
MIVAAMPARVERNDSMTHEITRALRRSCIALLSVGALTATGCAANTEDPQAEVSDDENIETTQQAFSWGSLTYFQRSTNLPTSDNVKDLGPDTGVTCFLAGVGGNLSSRYGAQQGSGQLLTTSNVDVYRASGHWWLRVVPGMSGGYQKLHGRAMCVNSVAGRLAEVGWGGGDRKPIAPVTDKRRCFLTGVGNSDWHYDNNDFDSSDDQVSVYPQGGTWWIGGSGNAQGTAVCIDVNGSYNEGTINGSQMLIGYNPNGVQCALTGVRGRFRTNDYGSGAFIRYEAGLGEWWMNSTSGKGASGQCFW